MHGLGWTKDPDDDRDYLWRTVAAAPVALPVRYRRTSMGPVLDQGDKPHCVGFSCASMKLNQEYRDHRRYYALDPDELYARCKERDGFPGDGTFIRVAMGVLSDRGILAHPSKSPAGRTILSEERLFPIGAYVRLTTLDEVKEAIFTVGPVVFGISVDTGFWSPAADGTLPPPNSQIRGGHAMCAVGWDDARQALRVKNSWGAGHGQGGYLWYPYEHFAAYRGWDAWRAVDAASVP